MNIDVEPDWDYSVEEHNEEPCGYCNKDSEIMLMIYDNDGMKELSKAFLICPNCLKKMQRSVKLSEEGGW